MKQSHLYKSIQECTEQLGYPVEQACKILKVSRSAYYKWLNGSGSARETENIRITDIAEQIHTESHDKGYRRIRDDLERYHNIKISDKRMLRICRKLDIKSTIKYGNNGCTKNSDNPQYVAENLLNCEFHADKPNEKWLTNVTEFKWYEGIEVHKVYPSAILVLYDRRIVAYVIGDRNDNPLIFKTVDLAIAEHPNAHPLFHSDRGFQYTNPELLNVFDNGPMEGFWGIIKRERYYGKRFTDKESLINMIKDHIQYYNNRRLQKNLGKDV